MDEKLLQYIWKYRLFHVADYKTAFGESLFILSVGNENPNSGPDFMDAKVKIGNTLWAGCVELHLRSSDWENHQHSQDKSYENVILHVVYEHDKDIFSSSGSIIPTFELKKLIDPKLIDTYKTYMDSSHEIVCHNRFAETDSFRLFSWLDRLLVERLDAKILRIEQLLNKKTRHKEEVFYHYLAEAFGFKINALPFSLLAESLPLSCLAKQKNSLLQLEAMLFGQADLLPKDSTDEYSESLRKEYHFLKRKFSLQPLCKSNMWKFAKMYPSGFPTIRIAQFAALIHQSSSLLSKVLHVEKVEDLIKMFSVRTSPYWKTHYRFGVPASRAIEKNLGRPAIYSLIINTVLPFMYAYSQWQDDELLRNKVVSFYESLPLENNTVVRKYTDLRSDFSNALHSQALIQLHNNYCSAKQCLHCGIGLHLMKMS
jgi:hypothetical protein